MNVSVAVLNLRSVDEGRQVGVREGLLPRCRGNSFAPRQTGVTPFTVPVATCSDVGGKTPVGLGTIPDTYLSEGSVRIN